MFTFTFSSSNGALNPFTARAEEQDRIQQAVAPQTITRKLPPPPKRPLSPHTATKDAQPSKKRGWAPTSSSASAPASQPTLTNGWIDTPSRYLEAASQPRHGGSEDDRDSDLPPAKRRKTLTGSIISTAFSAALIGTVVGMTAYRMWRDRGKPAGEPRSEPMEPPPPPYQRDEWTEVPQTKLAKREPTDRVSRLPRKPRSVMRRTPRRRIAPLAISPPRSPIGAPSPSNFSVFQQEETRNDQGDLEVQMDWMGDKIRNLIEEGQKALGKEIVIMSDEQSNEEGAEDDGMDGWEEESCQVADPSSPTCSSRRSRRRHPGTLSLADSASPPIRSAFPGSYKSMPASPRRRFRTATGGGATSVFGSPYLDVPNTTKLGGRTSNRIEDIKVLYEPEAPSPDSNIAAGFSFEDEDSRGLAERMEKVRRAYRIP